MRRAVVLLVLVIAACGGGSSEKAADTSTSTSTTLRRATAAQIASVVSRYQSDIRDNAARVEGCVVMDATDCDAGARLSFETLRLASATLRIDLQAADDPKAGQFVGAIPDELASLVSETIRVIDLYAISAGKVSAGHCMALPEAVAQPVADCAGMVLSAILDAKGILNQLDAWGPYL